MLLLLHAVTTACLLLAAAHGPHQTLVHHSDGACILSGGHAVIQAAAQGNAEAKNNLNTIYQQFPALKPK